MGFSGCLPVAVAVVLLVRKVQLAHKVQQVQPALIPQYLALRAIPALLVRQAPTRLCPARLALKVRKDRLAPLALIQ